MDKKEEDKIVAQVIDEPNPVPALQLEEELIEIEKIQDSDASIQRELTKFKSIADKYSSKNNSEATPAALSSSSSSAPNVLVDVSDGNTNVEIINAKFSLAAVYISSPEFRDKRKGIAILQGLLRSVNFDAMQQQQASSTSQQREGCVRINEVLYYLAVGHLRLGELHEARQYAQRLLKINPSSKKASALFDLVKLKIKEKQDNDMKNVGIGLGVAVALTGVAAALLSKR